MTTTTLLRYILIATIAAAPIWLFGSCINDYYPVEEIPAEHKPAALAVRVGLASATRADNDSAEKMHSVRLVLLDDSGKVEYNEHLGLSQYFGSEGTDLFDYGNRYRVISTFPGRKKIFIIANEESVTEVQGAAGFVTPATLTQVLSSKPAGSEGFETLVNALYFVPDYDRNLVMTSCYEFEVAEPDKYDRVERKEFWVVPAATKFTFTVKNYRSAAVSIEKMSVSALANSIYLMGHVGEQDLYKTKDGNRHWWVNWLRLVSEESHDYPENPDNSDFNSRHGWISDYTLPAAAVHADRDMTSNAINVGAAVTGGSSITPATLTLPSVYSAESRYMSGGSHNYTLKISIKDSADGKTYDFENKMSKVGALFRNTNVMVYISLNESTAEVDLQLKIGICRWDEETVEIPDFD